MRATSPLMVLLLLAPVLCTAANIRGVRPDLAETYAQPTFTCLDGSKTLDASRVNDEYCDCPDGSDEPGTSACPSGVFYCRNRGHEAKLLSSSFVDDGVCDCCDGTDEARGCKNTCIEKNAAVREGLKAKVAEYKQALDVKAAYVAQVPTLREEMAARAKGIGAEIAAKEKEVAALQVKADQLAQAEAKAQVEAAAKKEAEAPGDAGASAGGGAQPQAPPEPPREETAEERGRRIAAQWTSDPEAAGRPAGAPPPEAAAGVKEAATGVRDAAASPPSPPAAQGWFAKLQQAASKILSGKDASGADVAEATAEATAATVAGDAEAEEPDAPDAGAEPQLDHVEAEDDLDPTLLEASPEDQPVESDTIEPLHQYEDPMMHEDGAVDADDSGDVAPPPPPPPSPAAEAAEQLRAAEAALVALKEERERLGRQVGMDYGPNGEWLALRSHCVEAREPQYAYRACLFDKAAQVDNSAGHETNLGLWQGFEHSYTEAVFSGGDWCYQAPNRSLRVKITCALSESSWGASEPSTCVYVSNMATPVACTEEGLAELQAALDWVLEEEASLRAEIEADEAARAAAPGSGAAHDEL